MTTEHDTQDRPASPLEHLVRRLPAQARSFDEATALIAEFLKQHGSVAVMCDGHRGRRYRVTFDIREGGGPSIVESVYRRWNDTGRVYREIWSSVGGKRMSMLVCLAVRSAQLIALANISKTPNDGA